MAQLAQPRRTEPLTSLEAAAVLGVFDENPKLRAKYLDKHDLEMNPENPDQYRPKGSTGDYMDIDPGFRKMFNDYGWRGFGKELKDKLVNNAIPTAQAIGVGAAATGGALEGGLAGLAGGPLAFLSGPAGAVGAGVAQGAVASAAMRTAKHSLAEYLAGEKVPIDKEQVAYHAFVDGAMVPLMQKVIAEPLAKYGGKLADYVQGKSKAALENIRYMIGRGATPEAVTNFARNPELKSGIQIADQAISARVRKLFGTELQGLEGLSEDEAGKITNDRLIKQLNTPPEDITPDSDYGRALAPALQAAKQKTEELAANPKANGNVSEFLNPLRAMKDQLLRKQASNEALSLAEENALALSKGFIADIEKTFIPKGSARTGIIDGEEVPLGSSLEHSNPDPEMNYAQMRSWLSRFQNTVFKKNDLGTAYVNEGAPIIAKAIGGGPGVGEETQGLRAFMDKKASDAGSDLPQVNAFIHNVKTNHDSMVRMIGNPKTITNKFLPGSSDYQDLIKPRLGLDGQLMDSQIRTTDKLIGTNLESELSDLASQDWIRKISQQANSVGSSNVNAEGVKAAGHALVGEAAGEAGGGTLPKILGKLSAAAKAGKIAKLKNPSDALNEYIAQYARNEAPDNALIGSIKAGADLFGPVTEAATRQTLAPGVAAGAQMAGNKIVDIANYQGEKNASSVEEDPWSALMQHEPSNSASAPAQTAVPSADPWAALMNHK